MSTTSSFKLGTGPLNLADEFVLGEASLFKHLLDHLPEAAQSLSASPAILGHERHIEADRQALALDNKRLAFCHQLRGLVLELFRAH